MHTVYGLNGLEVLGLGFGGIALFVLVFMTVRTRSTFVRFIAAGMMVTLVASVWLNVNFVRMAKDQEAMLWPSIDRCGSCGERIYAWEAYERAVSLTATKEKTKTLVYGTRPLHVRSEPDFHHSRCPETFGSEEDHMYIEVHE